MPTTVYNIDRIKRKVPDASRADILNVLDEIQTIVYSQDCLQTLKLESTGLPPLLVTTKGVYQYNAPSDCRRIESIVTQSLSVNRSRSRPVGPKKEYYFRNKGFYKVSASTRDANITDLAKIFLEEDPGDTTNVYYLIYFIKPTPLTSEDVQLTLPEEVHYLVRNAVIAMYTTEDYGESGFDNDVIKNTARKIRNSLNRGYQGNVGETPIREEYQCDEFKHYYGNR
jgi:hypothetical protein